MSEQMSEAPSDAKARAVARPIPEEEPVITAILLARRGGILSMIVVELYGVGLRFVGGDLGCLCLLWDEVAYCNKRET